MYNKINNFNNKSRSNHLNSNNSWLWAKVNFYSTNLRIYVTLKLNKKSVGISFYKNENYQHSQWTSSLTPLLKLLIKIIIIILIAINWIKKILLDKINRFLRLSKSKLIEILIIIIIKISIILIIIQQKINNYNKNQKLDFWRIIFARQIEQIKMKMRLLLDKNF